MSDLPTSPTTAADNTGNTTQPPGPVTGGTENTTQLGLEKAGMDRIGEISDRIRKAVRAALPTPLEQFLTLMVPGKVVNLEYLIRHGIIEDFKVDKEHDVILPAKTELNQAILCDDMPTLSTLQMGPTGKSVARSYGEVISKLVPAQSTIGVDENSMTPGQLRYDKGMKFLSSPLPGNPGKTIINIYAEKQHAYTETVENRAKAFNAALERAQADPRNQHMDQEAMRLAVLQDKDGSSEYQKVKLEPSDWANKCLDRIKQGGKQTETANWYSWEITQLEKVNSTLAALKNTPIVPGSDQSEKTLETQQTETQGKLQKAIELSISARKDYQEAVGEKKDAALDKYNLAQRNVNSLQEEYDKIKLSQLSLANKEAQNKMLGDISKNFAQTQIDANNDLIKKHQVKLEALIKSTTSENDAVNAVVGEVGVSKPAPNPADASSPPDFFTPITVEVSASSQTKKSQSSATAFSAGGSATWGLGSVSASVSHSDAHSQASSEMANSEIKISFECMRVEIKRSWLNSELFYDPDLTPGPTFTISPGFTQLRQLMEHPETIQGSEAELNMYSTFPLYPTAFLVACNVVLEISGSTSSLQTYLNSSSTSASASVSYGPFSALESIVSGLIQSVSEKIKLRGRFYHSLVPESVIQLATTFAKDMSGTVELRIPFRAQPDKYIGSIELTENRHSYLAEAQPWTIEPAQSLANPGLNWNYCFRLSCGLGYLVFYDIMWELTTRGSPDFCWKVWPTERGG
ncbi:hypothetical protein FRC10_003146 [Ceratobasidium sp. 414]|nr:hypothetical protein FRC10_003146 [Ceratobasidium sp. 414]